MTAQIADTVEIDGVAYSVAGVRGGPLFVPKDHGIKPAPFSTAGWRGHACSYRVAEASLWLVRLIIGEGSKLAGRRMSAGASLLGGSLAQGEGWASHALAADVNLRVRFSGALLLGDGFIKSTYVHMGFHPAWKFVTVIEVVLDDGMVASVRDRSAELAAIRSRIAAGDLPDPVGRRHGTGWVKRSFSLDYDRSLPEGGA